MRILANQSIALCIDLQERLFPHIDSHSELEAQCIKLIQGLQLLNVPLLLTEQYPKGLGSTLLSVRELLGNIAPSDTPVKACFSCADDEEILHSVRETTAKNLIIFGIEAHVCVLQSVVDFRALGYTVVVVADCIGSRASADKLLALDRMRYEGAIISSCESLLFELCRRSGTDHFKQLSKLIK